MTDLTRWDLSPDFSTRLDALGGAGRAGLQPRRNRESRPLFVPRPAVAAATRRKLRGARE